jgi:hypothetical protein
VRKRRRRGRGDQTAEIRTEVQKLRDELAAEIRTRQLVVDSPDGFWRLRIDADQHAGYLTLRTRGPADRITCLDLVAHDAHGGVVGLVLTRDGNVVAGLESNAGAAPLLWLEDEVPNR